PIRREQRRHPRRTEALGSLKAHSPLSLPRHTCHNIAMRKRRILVAVLAALAATAILFYRPRKEPSYNGRPLGYWVRRLASGPRQDTLRAEAALRLAGTNAVPFLVEWLKEPPPGPLACAYGRLLWRIKPSLYIDYAPGFRRPGAKKAVRILGPDARAAVPALARMLKDPDEYGDAQTAAAILPHLGAEALPPLAAMLTNQLALRYTVINNLHILGTNASPLLPALVQLLTNSDTFCAV